MRSLWALTVVCLLSLSWWGVHADDEVEAGDEAQEPAAFAESDADIEDTSDEAVAAVWFRDTLYIAANTDGNTADALVGEIDIVVGAYDSSLDKENVVQMGGDGEDIIYDIAGSDSEVEIVIVGSTISTDINLFGVGDANGTGEMDWFVATLDPTTLDVNNALVNGTENEDQAATAVAVDENDGSIVVAGYTWGTYFEENAGSDNSESEVGFDVFMFKIDSSLENYEWVKQFGTVAYDQPSKVVIDDDSNIYVAGTTTDPDGVADDDLESMWVYKFDSDGNQEWSTGFGSLNDSGEAHGMVLTSDQDEVYISGNTQGLIGTFDGNSTGADELFLLSLSADEGTLEWIYQSESNATAFGTGGVVIADDGSPVIGGIAFGNFFDLSYEYWESGSGDMIAAKIDVDELEISEYFVGAPISNLTREDAFAMVATDDVEGFVYLIGAEDGAWDEVVDNTTDNTQYLILKAELEELPEEDDDEDDGRSWPYWPLGWGLAAAGLVIFIAAFKWAEHSQAQKAKKATMV